MWSYRKVSCLAAELLLRLRGATSHRRCAARLIVDHRGLAVSSGAAGAVGLGEDAIHAELGEVLAGLKPGRTSAEDITVFAAAGLPFQDLAAAWHVYQSAQGDDAVGGVDFDA